MWIKMMNGVYYNSSMYKKIRYCLQEEDDEESEIGEEEYIWQQDL